MSGSSSAASKFVHLHLHTDFSLLDGACDIKSLAEETARRGMPAVAVTDHGNLFAAQNFYYEAKTRGVKPIVGCEVYVAKGSRLDRGSEAGPQMNRRANGDSARQAGEPGYKNTNHLVLLCENAEGYQNLIKLVSSGFLEGFYYKPRIDHDLLAKHSRGLIGLSACLSGEVNESLLAGEYNRARESAYRLRDILGKGNFFLEVQDQGLEIEKKINPQIVKLSKETGIPLVATNDCHYLTQADARAQEVLLCIQTGKTMGDDSRMRFPTDQFYFKTAEEMSRIFAEIPESLERTWTIAERCNVKIEQISNPFPEFRVPESDSVDSYFEKVVREGFVERVRHLDAQLKAGQLRHSLNEYEARLSNEIRMIQRMKFAGYFLIVWDFIRYARAQGIPVGPGRGSAAGSLASYALRITDVDPLQYDLLFERFLNPERISLPDIDIDFCMRRRGEVIEYVTGKYGRENVAQIITFGTMAAKAAIKDVGRALEMPYADVDKLAKMVPAQLNIKLKEAFEQSSQLRQAIQDPRVKELFEIAQRLEGLSRHASTHAAGVVISPRPLTELVPVYKTNRDEITTQYDMKALDRLGLLKMDFLGLTTLTVVDDAVKLIEQNRGVKLDLEAIPLDDAESFKMFARGDTTAIFQFESHGMRDILRRYQPTRVEDLTALNALYRPGPIQGGMIDDFIARKHGKKKVAYDLPELKDILQETYGVIVYQEQVMQIANRLAGFSLGEADVLRRAMGKKKAEEMAAQREKFAAGCAAKKIAAQKAERIFDLMAEFAGYGFNKSHSCAYALLAYQTAWLKTHYPVEFVAALLTSEAGNTEKVVKYINEARGMGITVLPPDVNTSDLYFTPVGESIRFGLAAIKNVGETTARNILEARAKLRKFTSMFHFCEGVDSRVLNKRALESMIKSGAMDAFGPRERLMATMDDAITGAQKLGQQRASGQSGLFGAAPAIQHAHELREAEPWLEHDRLAGEYSTLGFYVSGHPLARYADRLQELRAVDLSSIDESKSGAEIAAAGIVVSIRPMRSRKGQRWAIFTLQDMSGIMEALAFPETFARSEQILKSGAMLLVRGRVQVEDAGTRIITSDIKLIDDVAEAPPSLMRVALDMSAVENQLLDRLEEIFRGRPGGCSVAFDLVAADGTTVTLDSKQHVRADRSLVESVRGLCGPDSVLLVREAPQQERAAWR